MRKHVCYNWFCILFSWNQTHGSNLSNTGQSWTDDFLETIRRSIFLTRIFQFLKSDGTMNIGAVLVLKNCNRNYLKFCEEAKPLQVPISSNLSPGFNNTKIPPSPDSEQKSNYLGIFRFSYQLEKKIQNLVITCEIDQHENSEETLINFCKLYFPGS